MDEMIKKLEKTLEDVTDLTDPASMDKVLAILEQSRKDDDKYMELLVYKLSEVEVTWEQPEYQTNYCLTRKPPPEEAKLCDDGHFTKAEAELFKKNWDNFVWKYNVPDTPIHLARWRNRTGIKINKSPEEHVRKFVAAYLAQGLRRNLYQVFRYFQITYSYPMKLRRYTPTEEKIMNICFYHWPSEACVIVSEVLGREPRGIMNKYSQYTKGKPEPKSRLQWTLYLAAKLIRLLMEYSECSFKKLKYNEFSPEVWHKVGEEMNQVPKYVREFWISKLHVQLFAKCSIRLNSLRKIIYKKLINSPHQVWSDVRWKDLAKEFPDGFTHLFLYNVAKRRFRGHANYLTTPLPELMVRATEDDQKYKRRNQRLKSLKYHKSDGTLSYVKHDIRVKEIMQRTAMKSINQ